MKTYQIKAKALSPAFHRETIVALVTINSNVVDAIDFFKDDLKNRFQSSVSFFEDVSFIEDTDSVKTPKVLYLNSV